MKIRWQISRFRDHLALALSLLVISMVVLLLIVGWLTWLIASLPVFVAAILGLGRNQRRLLVEVMNFNGPARDKETTDAIDIRITQIAHDSDSSFMEVYDQVIESRRRNRFRLLYRSCHNGVSPWRIRLVRFLPVPI